MFPGRRSPWFPRRFRIGPLYTCLPASVYIPAPRPPRDVIERKKGGSAARYLLRSRLRNYAAAPAAAANSCCRSGFTFSRGAISEYYSSRAYREIARKYIFYGASRAILAAFYTLGYECKYRARAVIAWDNRLTEFRSRIRRLRLDFGSSYCVRCSFLKLDCVIVWGLLMLGVV